MVIGNTSSSLFGPTKTKMAAECVELGFVEEVDNNQCLTSPFFPSKVGGKPAWLALSGLPKSESLLCKNCSKPLVFLLQVYVPSEKEDSTFHRTIFVFCCRNGACYKTHSNECFAVFRCQLSRKNEFYDPPDPRMLEHPGRHFREFKEKSLTVTWSSLCEVCGCSGEKRCGKCHLRCYCSKEHQTVDWKKGHKLMCGKEEYLTEDNLSNNSGTELLFPEYELVTEPEPELSERKLDEKSNKSEYEKYLKESSSSETSSVPDKEWEQLATESKEITKAVKDKAYLEFKKRISFEPEQVLRYQQNGQPLLVSNMNILETSSIPKCSCGADRSFEFQILPQLLNHLKVDSLEASIDWGTVIVYTCTNNCISQNVYNEEFIWKQDFSETGLPADILSNYKK